MAVEQLSIVSLFDGELPTQGRVARCKCCIVESYAVCCLPGTCDLCLAFLRKLVCYYTCVARNVVGSDGTWHAIMVCKNGLDWCLEIRDGALYSPRYRFAPYRHFPVRVVVL